MFRSRGLVYVAGAAKQDYSFLNTGRSTSGSVDILSVLRWLENSEHWIGNMTLGNVQFGWEITSSSGGMNFRVNSYWAPSG